MNFIKSRKFALYIYLLIFLSLAVLVIINPVIGKNAAEKSIILCGRIIIPSIFTFSALILFLMKIIPFIINGKEKIFIIIFSFIGGYPIGAKLISDGLNKKSISQTQAKRMLNYCINAGPAFIIGAVGSGLLSSKEIGYILFFSHILSSIFILLISGFKKATTAYAKFSKDINFSFIDSFTESVTSAANLTIGICSYVIFFSVLTDYIIFFSDFVPFLKYITFFLEVTSGITKTKNIYFISFLLGFSGFCIWCQILNIGKNIKINFLVFAFFRILHGLLSCFLTFILIKIFNISLSCFSNSVSFKSAFFYTTPIFSFSLLSLCIIFIISLFSKKYSGNIIDDML